jgi:hypothetical protein
MRLLSNFREFLLNCCALGFNLIRRALNGSVCCHLLLYAIVKVDPVANFLQHLQLNFLVTRGATDVDIGFDRLASVAEVSSNSGEQAVGTAGTRCKGGRDINDIVVFNEFHTVLHPHWSHFGRAAGPQW